MSCALDLDLRSQGWKSRRASEHSATILYRTRIAKCLRFGCLNQIQKQKDAQVIVHVCEQRQHFAHRPPLLRRGWRYRTTASAKYPNAV